MQTFALTWNIPLLYIYTCYSLFILFSNNHDLWTTKGWVKIIPSFPTTHAKHPWLYKYLLAIKYNNRQMCKDTHHMRSCPRHTAICLWIVYKSFEKIKWRGVGRILFVENSCLHCVWFYNTGMYIWQVAKHNYR